MANNSKDRIACNFKFYIICMIYKLVGVTYFVIHLNACEIGCERNRYYFGTFNSSKCGQWNITFLANFRNKFIDNLMIFIIKQSMCIKLKNDDTPWCMRNSRHTKKCQTEVCHVLESEKCYSNIRVVPKTDRVHIQMTIANSATDYGYIVLLLDLDKEICQHAQLKLCKTCKNALGRFVNNCHDKQLVEKPFNSVTFFKLSQNYQYLIILLAVVDDATFGLNQKWVFKTEIAVPSTPTRLQVVKLEGTILSLTWTKSVESGTFGHVLFYRVVAQDTITKVIDYTTDTVYTTVKVRDLAYCTEYSLNVSSVNKAGKSADSIVTVTTDLLKLANVIKIFVLNGYSTEKFIKWDYSSDNHCNRLFYQLFITEDPLYKRTNYSVYSKNKFYLLKPLKRNYLYSVKVAASVNYKKQDLLGNYSKPFIFYTGNMQIRLRKVEKPKWTDMDEIIIHWTITRSDVGNIYMFVASLILNKHCLKMLTINCKNCKAPHKEEYLDVKIKKKLRGILLCKSKRVTNMSTGQEMFSASFFQEGTLKHLKIHLIAINYFGVYTLMDGIQVEAPESQRDFIITITSLTIAVTFMMIFILLACIRFRRKKPLMKKNLENKKPDNSQLRSVDRQGTMESLDTLESQLLPSHLKDGTEAGVTFTAEGNLPLYYKVGRSEPQNNPEIFVAAVGSPVSSPRPSNSGHFTASSPLSRTTNKTTASTKSHQTLRNKPIFPTASMDLMSSEEKKSTSLKKNEKTLKHEKKKKRHKKVDAHQDLDDVKTKSSDRKDSVKKIRKKTDPSAPEIPSNTPMDIQAELPNTSKERKIKRTAKKMKHAQADQELRTPEVEGVSDEMKPTQKKHERKAHVRSGEVSPLDNPEKIVHDAGAKRIRRTKPNPTPGNVEENTNVGDPAPRKQRRRKRPETAEALPLDVESRTSPDLENLKVSKMMKPKHGRAHRRKPAV